MLQNAYLLTKIGADTAENDRNFAKIWQLPYGSPPREGGPQRDEYFGACPHGRFRDPRLPPTARSLELVLGALEVRRGSQIKFLHDYSGGVS